MFRPEGPWIMPPHRPAHPPLRPASHQSLSATPFTPSSHHRTPSIRTSYGYRPPVRTSSIGMSALGTRLGLWEGPGGKISPGCVVRQAGDGQGGRARMGSTRRRRTCAQRRCPSGFRRYVRRFDFRSSKLRALTIPSFVPQQKESRKAPMVAVKPGTVSE